MLGRVLLAARQFQESAHELETAKRLAPDSAAIRYQLAEAYRKLGRKQDADRETAAFNLLKDEQEVLAPPEEKLHPSGKAPEKSQ